MTLKGRHRRKSRLTRSWSNCWRSRAWRPESYGGVQRDWSNAERARVSVTKAIKSAIARIAEADADFGRHLSRTADRDVLLLHGEAPAAPRVDS